MLDPPLKVSFACLEAAGCLFHGRNQNWVKKIKVCETGLFSWFSGITYFEKATSDVITMYGMSVEGQKNQMDLMSSGILLH